MDCIDRSSKLPLYHQLYELIRGKIVRGEWKPGDMLPPETELMEQHQVSRIVVRQVFDLLVNEGLVYRERGRGTFVAKPTIQQTLTRIVSFTQDMRQRGLEPGTKPLAASLIPAPEDIAAKLRVPPGEELVRIERLRLASGEPMSVEEAYLVHRFCPGVLNGDYVTKPLREALERKYSIRLVRAEQDIRAVQAPRHLAATLEIEPKSAMLFIERVSYSQNNDPIEFLRIYYRGDRYALHNELQG